MRRFTFLFAFIFINKILIAQELKRGVNLLVSKVVNDLNSGKKNRVLISPFPDKNGNETNVSKYIADKFAVQIKSIDSRLKVTDRSQLEQILKEKQLGSQLILDPATIPQLGKMTGADVVITGRYVVLIDKVELLVKAIDLEQGELISAVDETLTLDNELKAILGISGPIDPQLGPLPSPLDNCDTAPSCVLCITNKSADLITARFADFSNSPRWRLSELIVKRGDRKCWPEVPFSPGEDVEKVFVSVIANNVYVAKYSKEIVPCQSFEIIHSAR